MTAVEFHTGIQDPVDFACRLLRKAHRRGVRVLVTANELVLARLDRELWTFEAREFIPHVLLPDPHSGNKINVLLVVNTPIWLATTAGLPDAPPVVLNLGAAAPAELAPIERLIEVLSNEPDDAEAGRMRWRQYKAWGLDVVHHVNAAPAP